MIDIVSFGGGVQSTAMLVLAALGKIEARQFIFCNVGDDSENPETIKYVHDVAMPYAEAHGLEIIELSKVRRSGEVDTLYQHLMKPSRTIDIPVRMANGSPGNRSCTGDFKIKVVDRWLREHGAKESGARVALGISLDEFQRMKANVDPATFAWKENIFPLIDLRMTRLDCLNIIRDAGLVAPPKSSCFFCPYHKMPAWQKMREEQPEQFWQAAHLEETLNERRISLGKDKVWLTSKLMPLARATTEMKQGSLFEENEDECESGYCFV